jgi:hypothetical protein
LITTVALSLVAGLGVTSPAAAATPTLDSFVQVTATSQSKGQMLHIGVKRLRDVPAQAGIRVALMPPKASRSTAPLDSWMISGPAGSETLISTLPNKVGVIRVAVTINAPTLYEERTILLLNAPGKSTSTTLVDAPLVAANIVAQHLPGVSLMFFPSVKLVKAAGFVVEGWSLYTDLQKAFDGALQGCPPLQVGQVIESTATYSMSGEYVQVWVTTKIWTSQLNQSKGIAPVCSLTHKLAEYS